MSNDLASDVVLLDDGTFILRLSLLGPADRTERVFGQLMRRGEGNACGHASMKQVGRFGRQEGDSRWCVYLNRRSKLGGNSQAIGSYAVSIDAIAALWMARECSTDQR